MPERELHDRTELVRQLNISQSEIYWSRHWSPGRATAATTREEGFTDRLIKNRCFAQSRPCLHTDARSVGPPALVEIAASPGLAAGGGVGLFGLLIGLVEAGLPPGGVLDGGAVVLQAGAVPQDEAFQGLRGKRAVGAGGRQRGAVRGGCSWGGGLTHRVGGQSWNALCGKHTKQPWFHMGLGVS